MKEYGGVGPWIFLYVIISRWLRNFHRNWRKKTNQFYSEIFNMIHWNIYYNWFDLKVYRSCFLFRLCKTETQKNAHFQFSWSGSHNEQNIYTFFAATMQFWDIVFCKLYCTLFCKVWHEGSLTPFALYIYQGLSRIFSQPKANVFFVSEI
jgi:hypothetical protein